jgi:hypothetical protein
VVPKLHAALATGPCVFIVCPLQQFRDSWVFSVGEAGMSEAAEWFASLTAELV